MSSRAALLLALALTPLAPLSPILQPAAASAAPEPPPALLWELPATAPCRLSLDHPDGAIEAIVGGTGARVLGEARRWQVAVAEPGGPADPQLRLTVGRRVAADDIADEPGAAATADSRPLVLEVPAGCDLAIRTGAGAVEVRGARLGRLAAESSTGDVTLWVQPSDAPVVELATSGEITVDFSIMIEYLRHQEPAKRGRIEASAGASWAQLRSQQGSIRVLKDHAGPTSNDLP